MGAPATRALAKCSPARGPPAPGELPATENGAASVGDKKSPDCEDSGTESTEMCLLAKCSPARGPPAPGELPATKNGTASVGDKKSPDCEDSGTESTEMCLLCDREVSAWVCMECASRLKISVVDADLDAALQATAGTGNLSYCTRCRVLLRGAHEHRTILLRPFRESWAAWDSGKESWSSLFLGVQADRQSGVYWKLEVARPFLLKPLPGSRCEVCSDHVAPATLFGSLVRYCTVECWLSGEGAAADEWATALVREEFDAARAYSFCFQCARGFDHGADTSCHDGHDVFPVKDFPDAGLCIVIPAGHSAACALDSVKDWAGGEIHASTTRRLRIKDNGAQRCRRCRLRLVEKGKQTCSLRCALPLPSFLPRPLQIKRGAS